MSKKPDVAIIYSDGRGSLDSFHQAKYLCGVLTETGHAVVHLIPLSEETNLTPDAMRIDYYPIKGVKSRAKKTTVPGSDYEFTTFTVVPSCDVVLVCVNREDTEACWNRIVKLDFSSDTHNITIFCLQRGLLNFSHVQEAAEKLTSASDDSKRDKANDGSSDQRIAIVCGMCAFTVVPHQKTCALTPLCHTAPTIVLERLTKVPIDPLNLFTLATPQC